MADSWMDGLAYEVMGAPLWAYLALVATFLGTYVGYRVLVGLLESRWLRPLSERQPELYQSSRRLLRRIKLECHSHAVDERIVV